MRRGSVVGLEGQIGPALGDNWATRHTTAAPSGKSWHGHDLPLHGRNRAPWRRVYKWQEEVGALRQSTEGQLSVVDEVLRAQARHRRSLRAGLAAVMLLAVFVSLWHGPGRPPAARIMARVPTAARMVTITELPSGGPQTGHPPAPVTITDTAVIRRLAALVDSLPLLSTTDPVPICPALGGIQLTFLARADGPPLAVAQGPVACPAVQFSARGNPQPALQNTDSFIPQVLKLAGLHWKAPWGGWPLDVSPVRPGRRHVPQPSRSKSRAAPATSA